MFREYFLKYKCSKFQPELNVEIFYNKKLLFERLTELVNYLHIYEFTIEVDEHFIKSKKED